VVTTTTGRVALFSIHPTYANAILDGTKQVEFRRTGLPEDVTHVVIYATSPVQRVVGVFEVAGVESLEPTSAWSRYQSVGGIDAEAFNRYYEGSSTAHVIKVRNPRRLTAPLPLADIDRDLRPPQSFQYLRDEVVERHHGLLTRDARVPRRRASAGRTLLSKLLKPAPGH
jgi:predicted transcriptional regulator